MVQLFQQVDRALLFAPVFLFFVVLLQEVWIRREWVFFWILISDLLISTVI